MLMRYSSDSQVKAAAAVASRGARRPTPAPGPALQPLAPDQTLPPAEVQVRMQPAAAVLALFAPAMSPAGCCAATGITEADIFNEPHLPDALRSASFFAADHDFAAQPPGFVVSLPQLLHARVAAGFDNEIWNNWFTTTTEESVVELPGSPGSFAVVAVHGGGVLHSPDRIEQIYLPDGMTGGLDGTSSDEGAKLTAREVRDLLNGTLPDGR